MQNALDTIVPVCTALRRKNVIGKLNNPGSVESMMFTFPTEQDVNIFVMALFEAGFTKTEKIVKDGLNIKIVIDN